MGDLANARHSGCGIQVVRVWRRSADAKDYVSGLWIGWQRKQQEMIACEMDGWQFDEANVLAEEF